MKKLIYAAGVLSLGSVNFAVQAAEGSPRPWSVGLTTQGFYDDNINTAPDGDAKIGSWGAFVSPSVSYAQTWDQTTLDLSASYGAYYYADTEGTMEDDWSQTANFHLGAYHTFNPRLNLELVNDFALFQNASQVLLGQTGRINGNNYNNNAKAALNIELSSRFSTVVGYENVLFRYEEDQYAAVLDRLENHGRVDLRYLITPKTVGVVGGKIGYIDYDSGLRFFTGDGASNDPLANPSTNIKDNWSYFAYGGFDHSFTQNLSGSLRAGAQIQDFDKIDSSGLSNDFDTQVNPYIDVSLSYKYAPGSFAQLGLIHRANPTDVTGSTEGGAFQPTLQQTSTAFYANVTHAITAKLSGSLHATFQSSEFVGDAGGGGGGFDGETEQWWSVGASASYAVWRSVSLTVAYYYDLLSSDIENRDYDRNRVFFGISATY